MPYFLVGIAALAVGLLALSGFARADVTRIARLARLGVGVTALGVAATLAIRGAMSAALPLAMLGAWLLWGSSSPGAFGRGGGANAGRASRVATEYVEMELDHASGAMSGRVRKGHFAGRDLATLTPAEVAELWRVRSFDDPASAQLLAAYLDQRHPTWREDLARQGGSAEPEGEAEGPMSREEARRILGVPADADRDAIRSAHRSKMQGAHPDHGGSSVEAARLNQARDILLDD
jgi:hypothetical protein